MHKNNSAMFVKTPSINALEDIQPTVRQPNAASAINSIVLEYIQKAWLGC